MRTINLLISYFTEKNERDGMLIKKGSLGYKLLFYPLYLLFLMPLFARGQCLAKIGSISILCSVVLYETMGRYLFVSEESIIQRISFIKRQEIYINSIKDCYIMCGMDMKAKSGYERLKIETENSFMYINMFYYRKKDLKLLCEKIGFPEVIKC